MLRPPAAPTERRRDRPSCGAIVASPVRCDLGFTVSLSDTKHTAAGPQAFRGRWNEPGIVSYAQNAEDVRLWRVFGTKPDGFYVDVGAGDPVLHSVTKLFYDAGWSGLNIEPGPMHAALLEARSRDINLAAAVSTKEGLADFWISSPDSGLSSFVPPDGSWCPKASRSRGRGSDALASTRSSRNTLLDARSTFSRSTWKELRARSFGRSTQDHPPDRDSPRGDLAHRKPEEPSRMGDDPHRPRVQLRGVRRDQPVLRHGRASRPHRSPRVSDVGAGSVRTGPRDRAAPSSTKRRAGPASWHARSRRWEHASATAPTTRARQTARSRTSGASSTPCTPPGTWRTGRLIADSAGMVMRPARRARQQLQARHAPSRTASEEATATDAWHFPPREHAPLEPAADALEPLTGYLNGCRVGEADGDEVRRLLAVIGPWDEDHLLARKLSWEDRQALLEIEASLTYTEVRQRRGAKGGARRAVVNVRCTRIPGCRREESVVTHDGLSPRCGRSPMGGR